jgi:uncharacterized protein
VPPRPIAIFSDGIRLAGLLDVPDETSARRPAILLCSGFQGLKEIIPAKLRAPFAAAGFVTFAFDYRGFGESDGERGRVIPDEQVADVRAAITVVQQQAEVDADRIGLVGWGFGGGIVVQAAALDERMKAVACLNGIGDGGRAVRATRSEESWPQIQEQIAADRVARALTGVPSRRVSPWDVVPLDPDTRANVDEDMYGRHAAFGRDPVSLESAEAYYAFRPERQAAWISPRPLLIVHGARNRLHPIAEARGLYAHAREPKTLIELPDATHLDWIQPDHPTYATTVPRIVAWFREKLANDSR